MTRSEKYPAVNAANRYARGVVSGKIKAPISIKKACQRHLDDLAKKSWEYVFDKDAAERVCVFLSGLVHVKGEWAGQFFELQPWQCFVVCSLFGWVIKETGKRRFRVAFIQIPRKQGKSFLAAGLGLYMLVADWEAGSEVYSGATSEKQAWEVFRPAKLIAEKTPGFRKHFGVEINAKSVNVLSTGSRFEPVIGNPGDGSSPHFWVVDEFHEHQDPRQYDAALTGMGARSQPLLLVITTAGTNFAGPCYDLKKTADKILDGVLVNDRTFVFVSEADDPDNWKDFGQWELVNLNVGVSVSRDFLKQQLIDATQQSSKLNINRTKHLNVWCNASFAWMNMSAWSQCANPDLRMEDFLGQVCWLGVDLASKTDFSVVVIVFKASESSYAVFGRYYLPESAAQDADRSHCQGWAHDGLLTLTPGNVTDYEFIERDILELHERFDVREVAFDPHQATYLSNRLMPQGVNMIEITQSKSSFSEPMKELEALVLSGNLTHGANPVMDWMMSNVTAVQDAYENIRPGKDSNRMKIDGPVALIMAIGRAMFEVEYASAYETRGVIAF